MPCDKKKNKLQPRMKFFSIMPDNLMCKSVFKKHHRSGHFLKTANPKVIQDLPIQFLPSFKATMSGINFIYRYGRINIQNTNAFK